MHELEQRIGYQFNDPKLLEEALTHSSRVGAVNNERLEFLGDAVLELSISQYLYEREHLSEGQMTKLRASIVCSESLSKAAEQIMLGDYLHLGRGEVATGGRHRRSILENAFEALIGSVFKDSNYETARTVVMNILEENIQLALKGELNRDYKTALQEVLQKKGNQDIRYLLGKTEGPEHAKKFYISLQVNGRTVSKGMGRNKKEAEQDAAQKYLVLLKSEQKS